jgi:apolipoprotein N-acyltransferase
LGVLRQYGIAGASALTVSTACGIAVAARGFLSSWLAIITATGVVILGAWTRFIQPLLTLKRRLPPAHESLPDH